ncbi:hypothetical protein [Bradymonas sediminis]|uniref:Uncharacterized protein n=1 Tax=Bradymonas sediminis TaxID=1548548 RepID=A0A2Z4FR54_9DELT|nr:hypothetical protein [Bradymonas sediminis]AWV91245.1 hypothetical protein DN745_18695 [Bradymonas sediminis]TDP73812.1 hypothetical protein DFR33_105144 [Bradymonas sediminis]
MSGFALMKNLIFAMFFVFAAAACGDSSSGHEDLNCEAFKAENGGGDFCDGIGQCAPVDCPCADGSTVTVSSCVNGSCEGESACASACAPNEYVCEESDNGPIDTDEPDAGGGSDASDNNPPAKSCVEKKTCSSYRDPDTCARVGCEVASTQCVHICDSYGTNDPNLGWCINNFSDKECPNLGATSESECTGSTYCGWGATCVNPVSCSDLDSESACSAESTCEWK